MSCTVTYNQWTRSVATLVCFGGLRSQDALQLDWRHVDWSRRVVLIAKSKTGRARTVPMHPRVQECLQEVWQGRGKPDSGPVFLSR